MKPCSSRIGPIVASTAVRSNTAVLELAKAFPWQRTVSAEELCAVNGENSELPHVAPLYRESGVMDDPGLSCVTIVHVSDTHNLFFDLPAADILVHSGDATESGFKGDEAEMDAFVAWWQAMATRFRFRVFVPGNHDHTKLAAKLLCDGVTSFVLVDQRATILGLKFYGTPWNNCCMAFHCDADARAAKFKQVPNDLDVFVTHAPPQRVLDGPGRLGCRQLADIAERVNPPLWLFGHIHIGAGMLRKVRSDAASTVFSNAAMADEHNNHACNVFCIVCPTSLP